MVAARRTRKRTEANVRAEARYRAKLGEEYIERKRQWRLKNRDRVLARTRELRKIKAEQRPIKPTLMTVLTEKQMADREKQKIRFRRWMAKEKLKPEYAIRNCIRAAMNRIVANGHKKNGPSLRYLGCSMAQAKAHIESQFAPGMTWENHGQWHIDHKKPLAAFNLTDPAEVAVASRWDNLQPLWAKENLSKGRRWIGEGNEVDAASSLHGGSLY
jgi:hypothetical protein